MSSFKENAAKELLTVLPSEREEELAFLCAVTKQAGYLHITGKRKNLVFALSSYEECLAVTGMLKDFYPTEFEIAVEHIKSGVKRAGRRIPSPCPRVLRVRRLTTSTPWRRECRRSCAPTEPSPWRTSKG